MSANVTDNNTINIEVSVATAEALGALLAHVSDMTETEGLSHLYAALDALGPIIIDPSRIKVEENPFAQDEDDDQFNIVVE